MFSEWALGLWSLAGIVWWLISLGLVTIEARRSKEPGVRPEKRDGELITVFKPLPPLGSHGLEPFERGLSSFIAELDSQSELLLGVHEADRPVVLPFLSEMHLRFPSAKVVAVYRSTPDEFPNPKVAWQTVLAPHARGELWLWSDADVVAPPGFLAIARAEFMDRHGDMLTFPYVIRRVGAASGLLDALFVNAEFYPGVLLLNNRGPVDFGLGAGMLFRCDSFLNKVGWADLGSALADDFVLGQKLAPVSLSNLTLEIVPHSGGWRAALAHHWRWSKTVWWNRPTGAAAKIIVLPVAGWVLGVILHPATCGCWLGLAVMTQVDVLFAALLCREVGCRWSMKGWLTAQIWVFWRVAVWLACWFPGRVTWAGRQWHGPRIALTTDYLGRH